MLRKSFTKRVEWFQVRTIPCPCGEAFAYLAHGEVYGAAGGAKFVSLLQSGLEEAATRKAQAKLDSIQRGGLVGRARCPHCNRYQSWMRVPNQALLQLVVGGFLGFIGVAVACGVLQAALEVKTSDEVGVAIGCGVGVLFGLLGFLHGVWPPVPAGQRDPAAMTFAELDGFLHANPEPERAWAQRANLRVGRLERMFAEINAGNPKATEVVILPPKIPHYHEHRRAAAQPRAGLPPAAEPPTARFPERPA